MNEWEWQVLEDKTPVDRLTLGDTDVRVGDRVRLRPQTRRRRARHCAGWTSRCSLRAIEQDYEGKVHVCVVLEDDPGRDLGLLRQPGHRFFFDAEEVEAVPTRGGTTGSCN